MKRLLVSAGIGIAIATALDGIGMKISSVRWWEAMLALNAAFSFVRSEHILYD